MRSKIQAITSRRRCHVVDSLMRVRRVSQLKSCGGDDFAPRLPQTKIQMIAAVIQTAAAILFFKTVRDAVNGGDKAGEPRTSLKCAR
jgi:hypothetical protein